MIGAGDKVAGVCWAERESARSLFDGRRQDAERHTRALWHLIDDLREERRALRRERAERGAMNGGIRGEKSETNAPTVHIEPDDTAARIRAYLYAHPELVYDEYRTEVRSLNGCCYLAAEAYYHTNGGRDSDLEIYCLSWSDAGYESGGTHWFLRDGEGGPVVDLGLDSREQASGIPYAEARHRAFITGYENPSRRTQTVLDAVSDTGGEQA